MGVAGAVGVSVEALVGAGIAGALVGVGIAGALAGVAPGHWLEYRRSIG